MKLIAIIVFLLTLEAFANLNINWGKEQQARKLSLQLQIELEEFYEQEFDEQFISDYLEEMEKMDWIAKFQDILYIPRKDSVAFLINLKNIDELIFPMVSSHLIDSHFHNKEKQLLDKFPILANQLVYISFFAAYMAYFYYNDGYALGQLDAFRHTYWNALLTKYLGEKFSFIWTSKRELYPNFKKQKLDNANLMDLYNNAIGRKIGKKYSHLSDIAIARIVSDKIDNGEMLIIRENQLLKSNGFPQSHGFPCTSFYR